MPIQHQPKAIALAIASLFTTSFALAQTQTLLDEVSVTATRDARPTKDVPQSIAVVGAQQIEDAKMFNVKDALQGIPGVSEVASVGGYVRQYQIEVPDQVARGARRALAEMLRYSG